jgi:hypothetical protein
VDRRHRRSLVVRRSRLQQGTIGQAPQSPAVANADALQEPLGLRLKLNPHGARHDATVLGVLQHVVLCCNDGITCHNTAAHRIGQWPFRNSAALPLASTVAVHGTKLRTPLRLHSIGHNIDCGGHVRHNVPPKQYRWRSEA